MSLTCARTGTPFAIMAAANFNVSAGSLHVGDDLRTDVGEVYSQQAGLDRPENRLLQTGTAFTPHLEGLFPVGISDFAIIISKISVYTGTEGVALLHPIRANGTCSVAMTNS